MKTVIFVANHKTFCAQRLGAELARRLTADGHEVLLAGPKKDLPADTQIPLLKMPAVLSVKNIASAVKKAAPQQVISLGYLPACEAARSLKIPYTYVEPENLKEEKPVKNKKDLLKAAKRVIVIGHGDKPLNKRVYPAQTVRCANPAVWVEHQNYNKPACFKKQNNLVAVANLGKESGLEDLLAVWAELAAAHPSWHLTIAGDGPAKAALKKWIEKNNLTASTELVCTACDPYALLRSADIYVSAARGGLGADLLLDAMACKLPAVAVQAAATENLVRSGINGVLVEAGDLEALRVALDDLMVNWGKRVDMAVAAAEVRGLFTFENFAALFEMK